MSYDGQRVPRGTSRRWEVIVADEERRPEAPHLRAIDVRAEHRILQAMSEDDLARIPLLAQDERLARFREHLDLHDPARANFIAEGTEQVKPGQRIVRKADVPPEVWDRLIEAAHEVVGWRRRRSA
jgi:hypothetical protein